VFNPGRGFKRRRRPNGSVRRQLWAVTGSGKPFLVVIWYPRFANFAQHRADPRRADQPELHGVGH
jgi:hypothetical protein